MRMFLTIYEYIEIISIVISAESKIGFTYREGDVVGDADQGRGGSAHADHGVADCQSRLG